MWRWGDGSGFWLSSEGDLLHSVQVKALPGMSDYLRRVQSSKLHVQAIGTMRLNTCQATSLKESLQTLVFE